MPIFRLHERRENAEYIKSVMSLLEMPCIYGPKYLAPSALSFLTTSTRGKSAFTSMRMNG